MTDEQTKVTKIDRLCSEIKLFDLCDLDQCSYKKDRLCTNEELLKKFESIKEEDEPQVLFYDEDDLEDGEETDFDEFDDEFENDDLE